MRLSLKKKKKVLHETVYKTYVLMTCESYILTTQVSIVWNGLIRLMSQ